MRVVSMDEQPRKNPFQDTFERLRARRWEQARTTARERVARLRKLRRVIVERREAIAEAIYKDFRKPAAEVENTEILLEIGRAHV